MRIPEDVIHILVSLLERYLNVDKNTWWCPTHLRFSLSKVIRMSMRIRRWEYLKMSYTSPFLLLKGIRMSMRIPEDAIHISISLCHRVFECRWEYLRMAYTSPFLFVEGYSNVDENTWRCHTHLHFSLSKGIQMSMRIPEDATLISISLCWRVFECW
jgi:hypothetical protein